MSLAAGEESSSEYTLMFPRQLPPREFVLQVQLFYSVGGAFRSALFFNETINVIEEPTLLDAQLLGLYVIGLALLAFAGAWWAPWLLLPAARVAAGRGSREGGGRWR